MVEYIVAIDVTRVRFPADAFWEVTGPGPSLPVVYTESVLSWTESSPGQRAMDTLGIEPRASRMLSGCDTTTPRALELLPRILRECSQSRSRAVAKAGLGVWQTQVAGTAEWQAA